MNELELYKKAFELAYQKIREEWPGCLIHYNCKYKDNIWETCKKPDNVVYNCIAEFYLKEARKGD